MVVILRLWLLPELGANGIADVPQLPNLDKSDVENMSKNKREVHGSSVKARQAWLAKTFRELMTTGQSFNISNAYRNTFYKNVTDLADEVNFLTFLFFFSFRENDDLFRSLYETAKSSPGKGTVALVGIDLKPGW